LGEATAAAMNDSNWGAAARYVRLGLIVGTWGVAPALAGAPTHGDPVIPSALPGTTVNVEMVVFADKRRAPVRLLRGVSHPSARTGAPRVEILTFKPGGPEVKLIRGISAGPDAPHLGRAEKVGFADARHAPVTIVRGAASTEVSVELYAPAKDGELDRIAFAVDGVGSRHGMDLRMWRTEFAAPQGPMQVSLKAALDVGGGDRFDLRANRLLGRAYLAQMFRRYGNWGDALAAYNWGPGNLDQWIAAGRPAYRLPFGVARYVSRVMHDALIVPTTRL
jgi:hypothetical protein